jgi:hypothetical protein
LAVGLFAVFVLLVTVWKVTESKARQAREATVAEFLRTADAAEKAKRPDRALSEIEAVIAFLKSHDSTDTSKLDELKQRRDLLSVREAEARIESAANRDPNTALGELLTLQARARTDRALDSLSTTIRLAIDSARRRRVEADFDLARKATTDNRPFDAIHLVEQAVATAEKLDQTPRQAALETAETILKPIVARRGVIIQQQPGQFALGSVTLYETGLVPILADALKKQGYAPKPLKGPIQVFWDQYAPVRLDFQITEVLGSTYLQSLNRTSEITSNIVFHRGAEILWQNRMTTRTQVPIPIQSAFAASRLAVSDKRSTESERLLHENAKSTLFEQVAKTVRAVPPL